VRFLNEELLVNPTTTGVTLSLLPAQAATLSVEYAADGEAWRRTEERKVRSEEWTVFELDGLEPGRDHRYRVRCATGENGVGLRAEHRFRTLRPPGSTYRFGFGTDTHVYLGWADAQCLGEPAGLAATTATIANAGASDLDFFILGGDEVMTHCLRCPPCPVDGESAGTGPVRTLREARLRYRVLRRALEPLGRSTPIFYALGNHDGEAGFGAEDGRCAHLPDTGSLSRTARLEAFPNPATAYSGGSDGNYLAFESGDALFVLLDVMRYVDDYPASPDDWTLGAEQLRWLEETLAASERRFKLLFAHHLVGGSGMKLCYVYGRGGARSTVDGTAGGRLNGEQARIHELMRRHGAQVFFSGHDHVFAAGEKDGILYVAGGQAGAGKEPYWTATPEFNATYDYDDDGRPDYLVDKGFVRVTVDGPRALRIEYVKSDAADPAQNGQVVFSTEVVP
jgi:3',5'-cyclic AMP phosphodiesterase CpdA